MRLACAALIVVASVLAGTRPASASTLPALPATVRVNVTGLGLSYAVISSTGTVSAIAPDGTVLYRGGGKTLARTNVRSVQALGVELPPRESAGSLSRAERATLFRDARVAIADSGARALVTVPFQFSLLQNPDDDLGKAVLQADKIQGITFQTNDGFLMVNGKAFRGTFELSPDDEGDMIIVNTVSTHDYLASVVGSEEPSSWEAEALASQAIAARTYLYTHLGKHRAYDLEGDTRDQEYDGTTNEDARTLTASSAPPGSLRRIAARRSRRSTRRTPAASPRTPRTSSGTRSPTCGAFPLRATRSRRTARGATRAGSGPRSSARRSCATPCSGGASMSVPRRPSS
jgi:Sporulation protein and related proteins